MTNEEIITGNKKIQTFCGLPTTKEEVLFSGGYKKKIGFYPITKTGIY